MNTAVPPEKILLVTVNSHETQAVLTAIQRLTGTSPKSHFIERRLYRDLGVIGGTSVFHALSEMGAATSGGSLQTVDLAIRALHPTMVIAVGIAFGVDEEKQSIGDILVSRQLWLYESQRVGDAEVVLRGDKPHASSSLVNLFEGSAQTTAAAGAYKVRVGALLTGEKLIDNLDYRKSLQKLAAETIGGEMEGGGIYVACAEHKVDWIVIKSICDWADGNKGVDKDVRQIEAANSAACFVANTLSEAFARSTGASPASSAGAVSAEVPTPTNAVATRIERITPLLEVLSGRLQEHRMMADGYFQYILNKVPEVSKEFETKRVEIDTAVVDIIGSLQIYSTDAFRNVVLRIRRIISCSWQSPSGIYFTFFKATGRFPREPIEAAQALLSNLSNCFIDMAKAMAKGEDDEGLFERLLAKHDLDAEANPVTLSPLTTVVRAHILEPEYIASRVRSEAMGAYVASLQPRT
jgi:nucleoside phosphorylase